ncbi:MAG TPA: hypothetical protein VIY30_14570, partial [Burkholderiaceae bacterium]
EPAGAWSDDGTLGTATGGDPAQPAKSAAMGMKGAKDRSLRIDLLSKFERHRPHTSSAGQRTHGFLPWACND